MTRRPPRYTRTDTLFPYTTLVRSCQLVPTQNRHARLFARIPIDLSPIRYKYDIIIISNDSEGKMVETGTLALNRSRETRSEEHTSELQSLMRISYAVLCLTITKEYSITLIERYHTYTPVYIN